MKFLVTGGAGYIGSEFVRTAVGKGHEVFVVDNLSRGHKYNLQAGVQFSNLDIRESEKLKSIISKFSPHTVVHFAGYALVSESVRNPLLYYQNNLEGTVSLLKAMDESNSNLVFSSSCAVYGTPDTLPMDEELGKAPLSPYGWSKLMCEQVIADTCKGRGLRAFALRYFNACGAALDGAFGEDHEPETHLIPNVINAGLSGNQVSVFGDSFSTPDGTCVRDYIHILDLAESHILAAESLESMEKGYYNYLNLGTGRGYSVMEIIDIIGKELGQKVNYKIEAPRAGDPASLYASAKKAKEVLNFVPKYSDIKTIVKSAILWHRNNNSQT